MARASTRPTSRCARVACVGISGGSVGGVFDRFVQRNGLMEIARRATRNAWHRRARRTGSRSLRLRDRSGKADPVRSRTARRAGTCRYLEIGPRVSLPSPAATARRQAGAGGPGPARCARTANLGDPDVRPTGTSRQYCPMNSGALLTAPAKQGRRRSKHTGDGFLEVGLEPPVAWVEALIPNGLSETAAVPRLTLPTSFRPGC